MDQLRVLQGHGVGALRYDPAEDTRTEFMDAGRTGRADEMRQVRQPAYAVLPGPAESAPGFAKSY